MHKLSALLLIIFVATIVSLSSRTKLSPIEMNLLPENSVMKRLNQVFLEIRASPAKVSVKTFDAFVKVIMKLLTDLQHQNVEHNKILVQMESKCNDEAKFRNKEIADANTAYQAAFASQKVCETKLSTAVRLEKETKSLLSDEQAKRKQRVSIRNHERKVFASEKAQYDDAVAFLKNFITMVRAKLNAGGILKTSFIEFSEQLLKHTAGLQKLEAAVPVLVMLSQLTSVPTPSVYTYNPDSNTAKSLVEKLNSLLNTLNVDLQTIINTENSRIVDFNAFIVKVDANIRQLVASLKTLALQILTNSACVKREQAIINTANAKRARNDNLAKKASKMCKEFADEALEAIRARGQEIQVVKQIMELLRVRFGTLPQNLLTYVASIEAGFAEYQNRTKLIAFNVYQKADIRENALGSSITAEAKLYEENKKF